MKGGKSNRERIIDSDRSKYPKHIPTIREQAEHAEWDLPEGGLTLAEVENMTAIGSLINPMALRRHLDHEYRDPRAQARMDRSGIDAEDTTSRVDVPDGAERVTLAYERGPDHPDTVFPPNARK